MIYPVQSYDGQFSCREGEPVIPAWLTVLSDFFVVLGGICALIIALDEFYHPQEMWVMNVVWPVVALFGTGFTLWGYFRYGRSGAQSKTQPDDQPFAIVVAKAASHCGAGCSLGDILAEWMAFFFPALAVWLGWGTLFRDEMFAVWILDFALAFMLGVGFQYFTIAPMRNLGVGEGIVAALKADTLSLASWQVGMYAFMALAKFCLFAVLLGVTLQVNSTAFWFMMQMAMICGFCTSYPVNWWLLRVGIKEKM